ncbi:pentapeptide repeat-containing protein [Acetobacterium fimetarium]|uniref:Pentapeptide repeat-containing protein n=1 Tax=Acetobacterium fimetarium TaxID=52691 RepID=A0ABR6WYC5_9FIRM|nr:pentapeptide repeat-containing protein [Acetobacterium fimetarium]MBC3805560.1 pentapeptide repeat-containing protein [Acetobacterium fimetarium]
MMKNNNSYADLEAALRIDCEKCSGLCCVALYCMKTDGFPENKEAGVPCRHLRPDFRCSIHALLEKKKMKGCLAYDCFGAGQKVTQIYGNENWQTHPDKASEIFQTFMIVRKLYQMAWYLLEAWSVVADEHFSAAIAALLAENLQITAGAPAAMRLADIADYQTRVNQVLKKSSAQLVAKSSGQTNRKDFLGKNFKKTNLDGQDFSMALLIAANLTGCSLRRSNFLGADLRDANIKDTDLREAVFLTQMQINAAQGNGKTQLPPRLLRPSNWPD